MPRRGTRTKPTAKKMRRKTNEFHGQPLRKNDEASAAPPTFRVYQEKAAVGSQEQAAETCRSSRKAGQWIAANSHGGNGRRSARLWCASAPTMIGRTAVSRLPPTVICSVNGGRVRTVYILFAVSCRSTPRSWFHCLPIRKCPRAPAGYADRNLPDMAGRGIVHRAVPKRRSAGCNGNI